MRTLPKMYDVSLWWISQCRAKMLHELAIAEPGADDIRGVDK
jgi:hypothetical protein